MIKLKLTVHIKLILNGLKFQTKLKKNSELCFKIHSIFKNYIYDYLDIKLSL